MKSPADATMTREELEAMAHAYRYATPLAVVKHPADNEVTVGRGELQRLFATAKQYHVEHAMRLEDIEDNGKLQDRIAEFEVAARASSEDHERLDWLEEASRFGSLAPLLIEKDERGYLCETDKMHFGSTLRAAIDAARVASSAQPEERP